MGWLAFLVGIATISPFPDGASGPRWAILSVALPLLLLRCGVFRFTLGHTLIVAFVLWAALSLFWTPDVLNGTFVLWHLALFAMCTFVAPNNMRTVYIGAGIALAINGLLVAVQLMGYHPVNEAASPAGIFFNKNYGAEASALVLVGLLGRFGYISLALALPMLLTIGAPPLSRTAAMGLVTGVISYIRDYNWRAAVLAVGIGVGALFAFVTMVDRQSSTLVRIELWMDAISNLTFFGHGVGGFNYAQPFFEFAHNDSLQVLYELGAPGLMLFWGFLLYCLWGNRPVERAVLLAFIVEGCFGFPLYQPTTVMVAGLAAGALLRDRPLVRGGFFHR